MKRTKKKPDDYPIFAVRMSQDDKDRITGYLEQLYVSVNRDVPDDEYKIRKNDILVTAIFLGIRDLKKNGYRWKVVK